jgi:hypothetical protein
MDYAHVEDEFPTRFVALVTHVQENHLPVDTCILLLSVFTGDAHDPIVVKQACYSREKSAGTWHFLTDCSS